ncbi:MAG: EI24 domain-containing protein [Ignavibacteria bacterium]|nr:EI24 domain-containing protein [Ignavibacteria bacterium]
MNNFIFGFFYPFRCIKLFFKYPKLILYSIVPVIINLIIYGTIFYYTYGYVTGKTAGIIDSNEYHNVLFVIMNFIMKAVSFLLVLLICYFAFVIFGGIVAAPFNEKISALIEEMEYLQKLENSAGAFEEALISIREELKKILFYIAVMIPVFMINFIPMIGNTVSLVTGSIFSFYYNSLDYMDYPLSRRLVSFRHKLRIIGSEKTLTAGFGAAAFILTFLPVINVLFNPLLVASGTSLFYKKDFNKLLL